MTNLFVENFSIKKIGYSSAIPTLVYGFDRSQELMLGECIIKRKIFVYEGFDLKQALMLKDELDLSIEKIIKLILNEPEKVMAFHNKNYEENDLLLKRLPEIEKRDLKSMSNKELGLLFRELLVLIENAHSTTLSTTWFVDSEEQKFSKLLMNKTEEYAKDNGIDTAKAFSLLTTKPKDSILLKEEIESLEVLSAILSDKASVDALIKADNPKEVPSSVSLVIKEKMRVHFEKWRWIQFGYMGPAYEMDYYLAIWRGMIKERVNPKAEIEKLKSKNSNLKKERDNLKLKLGLSKNDEILFDIGADIAFLKGYRKDISYYGCYVLDKILLEMAKRKLISRSQLYVATYLEIEKVFLQGGEFDTDELNKRMGFTFIDCQPDRDIKIYTGKKAQEEYTKLDIIKEEVNQDQTEFAGTCACSGKATGAVKIVNDVDEIPKMNQGDIMVSHTTFPSLVPAMKKAAAIITEDGGVTCHAAIVSREMGIPCIVGTRFATKIFKDGDLIEVDAEKGIVRKL